MKFSIWGVFSSVARAVPDRVSVIDGEQRSTYRDLADRSHRIGAALAEHGLGVTTSRADLQPWEIGQDTVAMYMRNRAEHVEVMMGAYAARTAPFNVNYLYVPAELEYLFNDARPGAVFFESRYASTLAETLERLEHQPRLLVQVPDESQAPLLPGARWYDDVLADADATYVPTPSSPDDIYLLYTGGTTGMPKGVLWRQEDHFLASLSRHKFTPTDVVEDVVSYVSARDGASTLVCMPLMHGAGQGAALSALMFGETIVLTNSKDKLDPHDVWTLIERERIRSTAIVGDAFAIPMLDELEAGDYDASTLTVMVSGGAPLSARSKARFAAALPRLALVEGYAASETASAANRVERAGGPAVDEGVFVPNPGVSVLNPDRTAEVRPGDEQPEPGWFAKSGHIPLGYLGDETKTAATFITVDGVRWAVPGDRARVLDDGSLALFGRDSACINTGGEKVFAEEVEAALQTLPGIVDVAVAGRPSERWGSEVTALVQVAPGTELNDEELRAGARTLLSRYKVPKAFVRVEEIQRTAVGKIDRSWAARAAAEKSESAVG